MTVGRKDPGDVNFQDRADITIDGVRFENQDVRGDRSAPKRRGVFLDEDILEMAGDLPRMATVNWQGRRYSAQLSFRTGIGGARIPVYQFFVESNL